MEKKTKVFRLNDDVISKIEQLVFNENQKDRSNKTTQTDIVIDAINKLHANTLGKDVMDENMERLEMVIGNRVDKALNEYNKTNAISFENLLLENRILTESILVLIRAVKVLPDDLTKILPVIKKNQPIEDTFREIVKQKIIEGKDQYE